MDSVLVVDDSPHDLQTVKQILEKIDDLRVETAHNGFLALEKLQVAPNTLVISGIHMLEMDGLELLRRIRQTFPLSPVIVMTGRGTEELAAQALNGGASGYVPKRYLNDQLPNIVLKVLKSIRARDHQNRLEQVLDFTETRFVLGNDVEMVPSVVGYLQEKINRLFRCDYNELLRIGLALDEALVNAIYHGNLEVGSELRESCDPKAFFQLARQRREQPPYADRKVYLTGRVSSENFVCIVRDEGPGFQVDAVPDPLAPENLERPCGRGLLLIRQFMDKTTHNDKGNEITIEKKCPAFV